MTTRESSPVTIFLSCHHALMFRQPIPSIGDLLYCQECHDYNERIRELDKKS